MTSLCAMAVALLGCRGDSDEVGSWGSGARATVHTPVVTESCLHPLPILEAGAVAGRVCPDQARARGLTIVDLSDDWVPSLFRTEAGEPENRYRSTYVALANQEFGRDPTWDRARKDVFLELYGILPTFRLIAARLAEQARFACHGTVDSSALAALKKPNVDIFAPPRSAAERAAFAALDARLVCEGLLLPRKGKTARPRWRVQAALEAYQRKHTIVTRGMLDRETRRFLAEDPRELEFRALLRVLRARVVDATGIIEDGSARGERAQVLGRRLDGDAFYRAAYDATEEGAPDLVSAATETAARALGWTDAEAASAFFRAREAGTARLEVALRLPAAPDYHASHMELRAEIDRGDVWYERPNRRGRVERRPTMTLWTTDTDGNDVALIRWPTTIGGWKKEVVSKSGRIGLVYKNSDVGARVWRDLIAVPAWLPPPMTPPRTMVRRGDDGTWLPDTDLVGPGYASAYGLAMLVHHDPVKRRGKLVWEDNGIRTHGSVSYDSIQRGESHGCHRLFNQSAVQLASFLVQHRNHVRHGLDARRFVKIFDYERQRVELPIPHRGYRFELTPPVAVEVLKGRIRGKAKRVPTRVLYVRR